MTDLLYFNGVEKAVKSLTKEEEMKEPVLFIPNRFYISRYHLILYVTDEPAPLGIVEQRPDSVTAYWAVAWEGIEKTDVRQRDLVAYAELDDIMYFYRIYNHFYKIQIEHHKMEIRKLELPQDKWNAIVETLLLGEINANAK